MKMKILQFILKEIEICGIGPSFTPFNKRNLVILSIFGFAIVSSGVYFFYEAKSYQEYANSILTIAVLVAATWLYAYIIWKMRSFLDTVDDGERIIDERLNYPISKTIYTKSNCETEKFTKLVYSVGIEILYPAIQLSMCLANFYTYFTTELGNEAFWLPFPYWLPFDWKNPQGYLVAFIIDFIFQMSLTFLSFWPLSFGIGMYILMKAFTADAKNELIKFIEFHESKRNRDELLKQLIAFIKFQSIVQRYVRDCARLFQPIFVVLFAGNIITICVLMLLIQMELKYFNFIELMVPMFELCIIIVLQLASCELPGQISNGLDNLNNLINQFDWYSFPHEIQQMLPLIMLNAQQTIGFPCFGSHLCNRDTFKKVVKCAFSYFMVLRTFI